MNYNVSIDNIQNAKYGFLHKTIDVTDIIFNHFKTSNEFENL